MKTFDMNDMKLYTKLMSLPKELKKEADDFVDFLISKMENNKRSKNRKPGLAKGLIEMKEDFDEPLEDFKDYRE